MFHSLFRAIKFASQDFWRNIWLSLITISILVLALLSVNSLIVFRLIADQSIKSVQEKVDVSIYFYPEVTAGEVNNVKSYLHNMQEVKEATYIAPEEALADFREEHRDEPEIIASLEEVGENPIGPSLIIKAQSLDDYPEILRAMEQERFQKLIQEKNFEDHKAIITKINDTSQRVEKIALGIIGVFTLISVLIIFNTIKVAIYTHRQEIEIKRLVGATNWFIKAPYLLEGIFYSVLSVFVVLLLVYPIVGAVDPYIKNFFSNLDFSLLSYFNINFWYIFGTQLLAVVVLNIVSSYLAIGKYVKV